MEDIKGTNDEDDKSKDMEEHSKESQWRLGFDQEEERMVSKSIIFLEKKLKKKLKKKLISCGGEWFTYSTI
jgi:hypothetical protein